MQNAYTETTNGIQISVRPEYMVENSNPQNRYFFFAYHVEIKNVSQGDIQVLNRHWIIRDGDGQEREVKGEGIVGHQPLLKPSENFQYTSFCPLSTPTGNMRGTYELTDQDGQRFEVKIPLFFLRANVVHSTPQPPLHNNPKPSPIQPTLH